MENKSSNNLPFMPTEDTPRPPLPDNKAPLDAAAMEPGDIIEIVELATKPEVDTTREQHRNLGSVANKSVVEEAKRAEEAFYNDGDASRLADEIIHLRKAEEEGSYES